MMHIHDIVIIGAGLAGSSIATTLATLGWDVVLLEKRTLPTHKVCGEFLSPEAQASLRALGLFEVVQQLGPAPMERALLVTPRNVRLLVDLPATAWGISRYALDVTLAEAAAAAGATVRTGTTVQCASRIANSYRVEVRDRTQATTLYARAVVVAAGRHLPAGLRAPSTRTDQSKRPVYVGVKAHYAAVALPPQVELYLVPGGYVGLGPVETGHTNLCMLVRRELFRATGSSVAGIITATVNRNPALAQRLNGARLLPETVQTVAPVDTGRPPVAWAEMPRLGDAATMIPPLCGDGMAMALRSAELCIPLAHDYLTGRCSLSAWEAAYRAAYQQEFAATLRTGRHMQSLLARPVLADLLLTAGNLLPFGARQVVKATRGRLRDPQHVVPLTEMCLGG